MQYYVAVVGGANCSAEEKELACQVGAGVARRGGILICGGGSGVMEAASQGAVEAGGEVIGILPGEDHRMGNHYLKFAIATGLGEARNAIIARTADAVIAVGGEYGTLSEIALALKMNKPVKPIVVVRNQFNSQRVQCAFWERSYLSRFNMMPLR